MSDSTPFRAAHRILGGFYRDYEFLAVRVGVAGNALFVVGSILFLVDLRLPGTICFLMGSIGMLVRAGARLYVDERIVYERFHGRDGGEAMAAARQETDTAPP